MEREKFCEQYTLEELNQLNADSMIQVLGIRYTYVDEDRVEATMPVDHRTCQPFGFLAGGSTLALVETLAGLGSLVHIPKDKLPVGMQVSASHVSAVPLGETVRGIATPIHLGRSTHVWNVDVVVEKSGKLVSSARVTNQILDR